MDYLLNIYDQINNIEVSLVLNLIINGLPSKLWAKCAVGTLVVGCFKPYYKWITF